MFRTEGPSRSGTGPSRLATNAVTWFGLYALIVSALEVCAYVFKGIFSIAASRVWLLGGVVFLVFSLVKIWSTFRRDAGERFFWGIATAFLVAGMMFWRIQSLDYALNGEGTHQVTVGLGAWMTPDLGYTTCGHFCYPTRQYLLAALPTRLFGRQVASVRLGFLWITLLGMLLFYSGLRERLRSTSNGGYLAAMAMLLVLTFPVVTAWLSFIEQVMIPPSVMLAAVGWYLLSRAEVGPMAAFCLSWIGAMMATVYTPGLAGWALVISVLLLTALVRARAGRKREAALLVLAVVIIVSFGASSFATRGDVALKLHQERRGSLVEIGAHVAEAYQHVFFLTGERDIHDQPFMSLLFLVPLVAYVAASLLWRNGTTHFVNALWILGVVGGSCYFAGYAIAPPGVELRKALILIPPAVAGTLIVGGELLERTRLSLRKVAGVLFLVLGVTCVWNLKRVHRDFADSRDRRLMEAVEWLRSVGREHAVLDTPIDVYVVSAQTDFNLRDYVEYFFPKMQNFSSDATQCFANFAPTRNALILYEDSACESRLNEIRAAHQDFHTLPVKYGLKGFVFTPRGSTPPAPAKSASGS